jgi:plastocyanin
MDRSDTPARRARWALGALVATATVVPALLLAPAAAAHEGAKTVEMEDKCEPESFAAIGVPCVGDGDVTVEELLAKANQQDGGHEAWRFDRDDFHIRAGEHVHVVNAGGEAHTFSPVARFGRTGVVPPLDEALPPGDAIPLGDPFASFREPGGSLTVSGLTPGTYLFQCFIHPWMQSTITVRPR